MKKKPVFENFPFHTLGYENFGCFFLMPGTSLLRGAAEGHARHPNAHAEFAHVCADAPPVVVYYYST
jgi:hypothetical protein